MAFNSLLNNMELIKRIYLNATNGHRFEEVTKGLIWFSLYITKKWRDFFSKMMTRLIASERFLHSAQMMSQITPLEVDILFQLCDLLHQTGWVSPILRASHSPWHRSFRKRSRGMNKNVIIFHVGLVNEKQLWIIVQLICYRCTSKQTSSSSKICRMSLGKGRMKIKSVK